MAQETASRVGTVLRVPEAKIDEEAFARALDESVFQPLLERADRFNEEREWLAASYEPVYRSIVADDKIFEAFKRAVALRKAHLADSGMARPLSYTGPPGAAWAISSLSLPPGTNFFFPPYDSLPGDRQWGSPTIAESNLGDLQDEDPATHVRTPRAALRVECPNDEEGSGTRTAAASVAIQMMPTQAGRIHVRPLTRFEGDYLCLGLMGFDCHSEGNINLRGYQDSFDHVLDHRDLSAWNVTTDDTVVESPFGYAIVPNGWEVSFDAQPGKLYSVAVTASVSGNQSGDRSFLWHPAGSWFRASMKVWIPFITVELEV